MVREASKSSLQDIFTGARSDYRASKETRFSPRLRGVVPTGSGADYHYRNDIDYLFIIERAREIERNDPIVGSGLRRLTSNVVQEGFTPDPNTGLTELDDRLKELWQEWSTEPDFCHSEGEFDFYQLERLAFSSIVRDGDFFTLMLNDESLQMIEGHRPRTPRGTIRNVVHGINLDERAKRKEVWFTREDLSPYHTVRNVRDVERYAFRDEDGRRQVLQGYFPRRFSQRRGVSALAPITDIAGQHDDLQFSALVKQQLSALVVLLEEQDPNAPSNLGPPGLGGVPTNDQLRSGLQDTLSKLGPGIHYRAPKGVKVSGFSPQVPGEGFLEHSLLLMTFIAVNLDLPLQVLLLDPTKTNFSGWRGAIDEARKRYREMQRDLMTQFHRPIYRWLVRRWISSDPIAAQYNVTPGVNAFKHTWKIPGWPYIEPFKDAQADSLRVRDFLAAPSEVAAERGKDWDERAPRIVRDKMLLIKHAIQGANELNGEFPDAKVDWRTDILGPGLTSAAAPLAAGVEPSNEPEPATA